jgi:hypothetical protein
MLLLLSCAPVDQAFYVADAQVEVGESLLAFGEVGYLLHAEQILVVRNIGAVGESLVVTVEGEHFGTTEDALWLGDREEYELGVWFEPTQLEAATGTLHLSLGETEATVELTGETNPDVDGDGHLAEGLGGDDCDDLNENTYPGATERWYDGVDSDCGGDSDFDADGDGWDADPEGSDCDDEDEGINPDSTEVWYDGVDQDCSGGSDYDADGDTFDAEPWGQDCDDTDPARVVGC